MKAIETLFDGRRFRSRLEARYAVFFKNLGMEYRYEVEGYELNGKYYLPDFFIPSIPLWVEVKGQNPSQTEEDLMSMLVDQSSVRGTIVGPIESIVVSAGTSLNQPCCDSFHNVWFKNCGQDSPYWFCECTYCGAIGYEFEGRAARIKCCNANISTGSDKGRNPFSPRIERAYSAAMQARFEHGDNG